MAEVDRVACCGVLIIYVNSLNSWGFAWIPEQVVTLYFIFIDNGGQCFLILLNYFGF